MCVCGFAFKVKRRIQEEDQTQHARRRMGLNPNPVWGGWGGVMEVLRRGGGEEEGRR